mgnify:CR=1 FL=1
MKKYIPFVLFIFVLPFFCATVNDIVFANDNSSNYGINIVVKNFDNLKAEYRELFFNISIPLTIESEIEIEKENIKQNKQIIAKFNEKDIKKFEISTQNPQKMRNIIYNAISYAKDEKCYLIFNLDKDSIENGYFALVDTLKIFYSMKVSVTYFNWL